MMAASRGAGKLRDRLHFQRRDNVQDDYGNTRAGDWVTVFTAAAEFIPLRGGETVMAARLAGQQPYVIRIRSFAQSRAVDPSWRIVDARNEERVFNITAIVDPDNKRAWLDVTATQGVAT
jgi:head-tail adaptor